MIKCSTVSLTAVLQIRDLTVDVIILWLKHKKNVYLATIVHA